jgi:hypothetical protein
MCVCARTYICFECIFINDCNVWAASCCMHAIVTVADSFVHYAKAHLLVFHKINIPNAEQRTATQLYHKNEWSWGVPFFASEMMVVKASRIAAGWLPPLCAASFESSQTALSA